MSIGSVAFALGLTLFSGLSTAIGAALAVVKKRPGPAFMAVSLGLSAGVMVYVSFMDLLPEATGRIDLPIAVGAFFAGIVVVALIDRLVPEDINPHEPGTTEGDRRRERMMKTGVLTGGALMIHNFPEGFVTFLSALEDPHIAVPIAVAIAIHNIPEGVAVAVPLRTALNSRKKAFWWATVSGLAEPVGAFIGFLFLMPFLGDTTLGVCFAAIAGVMVFISFDELLPTAEETGRHHWAIYGLIAGMAVMAASLLIL